MKTQDAALSILELSSVVTDLFERSQRPLLPGAQGPLKLFVRYLRRKPGRGLAVVYAVDEARPAVGRRAAADIRRSVSLTLDEEALTGAQIRFTAVEAQHARVEVQPSGALRASALCMSAQAFPADSGLPALAASCDARPGTPLFRALEQAAQVQVGNSMLHLVSARAEPVRYKPANRCVLRYMLRLDSDPPATRDLTLFGKVFADPEQAGNVHLLQRQLYEEQLTVSPRPPFLPRPLGLIEDLGMAFSEAVQSDRRGGPLRTGRRALRVRVELGSGGRSAEALGCSEELELTARALASLHSSEVRPNRDEPRTALKEAKRTLERAALIEAYNPAQAESVCQLAQRLAARLEGLQPDAYLLAHGSFKPSQLLFHGGRVFVVDFDGCCLADPALDVGYFLAYLRPSGLWYGREGMRGWFQGACHHFVSAYRQAMLRRGWTVSVITGILLRSRLYEAAVLFKIATRRVNRLNSPRPNELSAMLGEIAACLER